MGAFVELRSRNWLALLALWTALATWLILIGTGVAIGSDAASEDLALVLTLSLTSLASPFFYGGF